MARKPKDVKPQEDHQIDEEVAQSITETQNQASALVNEYTEERDLLNQIMGQVQMTDALAKLTTVVGLTKMLHIKETRMYRALKGKKGRDREGNEIADVGTWGGFCLAMGTTRQKVDEDLLNVKAFGETALEDLSRVGAGYRDLRQFRRLPENEKTALIEAAQTGDKDAFVEVAEQIISKHTKEKEELQKKLDESEATMKAQDEVIGKKQSMITDLQTKAELVKNKPVDEVAEMLRSQANSSAFSAEAAIRGELAGALEALFEFQAENDLDQTPFAEGLVRQVQVALDDVCSTYGIAVDGGSAVPAWQRDDADEVVAQAIANEQAD